MEQEGLEKKTHKEDEELGDVKEQAHVEFTLHGSHCKVDWGIPFVSSKRKSRAEYVAKGADHNCYET